MSAVPFYSESAPARSARVNAMHLPGDKFSHGLAIVGAGMIGREHMRVATLLGRARIAWPCRIRSQPVVQAGSRRLCQQYAPAGLPAPKVYDSLEAITIDPGVTGIFICSPQLHAFRSGEAVAVLQQSSVCRKTHGHHAGRCRRDTAPGLSAHPPSSNLVCSTASNHSMWKPSAPRAMARLAASKPSAECVSTDRCPFLDKVGQRNKFNATGRHAAAKCCHYFDLINLTAAEPVPERRLARRRIVA